MKKLIFIILIGVIAVGAAVFAQGPGYGPGWRGGPGMMGPGMGWGPGQGCGYGAGPGMMWGYGHHGYGSPEFVPPGPGISIDQAKEIAKQYADKYLKGFSVELVLPFTGMPQTMYGVDLKGPKGEVRHLYINPWGGVMPFMGGPWAGRQ